MAAMNAAAGSADWHPAARGADQSVSTSTTHAGINAASDHLAAIVVARLDMDTTLTAAEVILDLADVSPPLPPLTYPDTGPSTAVGVDQALAAAVQALAQAAETSPETSEALRAAYAVRDLRALQARRAQDPNPIGGHVRVRA